MVQTAVATYLEWPGVLAWECAVLATHVFDRNLTATGCLLLSLQVTLGVLNTR